MTFYFTFQGAGTPGRTHYAIVTAACEETAIAKVRGAGGKNWSVISTSRALVRKLELWRKI